MDEMRKCSFCGRLEKDVELMIPSPKSNACICDFCIELCSDVLDEFNMSMEPPEEELKLDLSSLPTPKEMKKRLDEYVIGQDKAKIALSVAVYNHYKRLIYKQTNSENDDVDIKNSISELLELNDLRVTKTNEIFESAISMLEDTNVSRLGMEWPFSILDIWLFERFVFSARVFCFMLISFLRCAKRIPIFL